MTRSRMVVGSAFVSVCLVVVGCIGSPEGISGAGTGAATGGHTATGSGGSGGGATTGSGGSTTIGTGGSMTSGTGGATTSGTGGRPTGGTIGTGGRATGGTTGTGGSTTIGTGGRATGGISGTGGNTTIGTGGRGTGGTGGGGALGSGGRNTGGTTSGTGGGTTNPCGAGTAWTGGKTYSSNTQGNVGNGYAYQLWSSGQGTGSMTVAGVDAKFSATWNSVGDFLARVGLGFSSKKTPSQIGTLSSDFSETKTGSGGGFSYIGIYGWSENPLIEYYIIDDWFGSRPVPGTKKGTITVDGGTYDVLTHTQTNQPSILGTNSTFEQFWSVRQTARTCGTISISEHFTKWAAMGMQLGTLDEAKILVEIGGGTGSINFTTATVTLK